MEKLDAELLRAHKGKSFVGVSTAVAIFNHKGQLFLAQRSENTRDEHGRWDVCGGGLKWGETIENNSRREMNEEFAVESDSDLIPIGYRQAFRTDQNGDKTHWICMDSIIVLSQDESKKVKINEPENFTDSGWFNLDNLPSPLHSVIDDTFIQRLNNAISELGIDKA
jgi:ADP-ribose pyrophosphatase YjhB (NUDIX family)